MYVKGMWEGGGREESFRKGARFWEVGIGRIVIFFIGKIKGFLFLLRIGI